MCFDLNGKSFSQANDFLYACQRRQGHHRKKEISHLVPASQYPVESTAVKTLAKVHPARFIRKTAPDNCFGRQQSSQDNVGAEVNMMMAINAVGVGAEEAPELGILRFDYILEGRNQAGMENRLMQPTP